MVGEQFGGFELHPGCCEGVLDGLVLAYGAGEDDAVPCVGGGFGEGGVAEAESFASEEAAFGVHAVEDLWWRVC